MTEFTDKDTEDIFGGTLVPGGPPDQCERDVSSGDGVLRDDAQMQFYAKQQGCSFKVAADDELFIDIDTEEDKTKCWENLKMARNLWPEWFAVPGQPIRGSSFGDITTPSKSGAGHYHIRVKLKVKLPLLQRLLLQACLGSDLKRELASMKRALAGEDNVVVFFEKESVAGSTGV